MLRLDGYSGLNNCFDSVIIEMIEFSESLVFLIILFLYVYISDFNMHN